LSVADGRVYAVGTPFSFSTSYDDAVAQTSGGGYYNYAAQAISFQVGVDSYLESVLYYTEVSSSTLRIGPPGDYATPVGILDITLGRSDPTDLSLPGAMELDGNNGVFSFRAFVGFDTNRQALWGSGSGSFITSTVPEPETWAMMLIGCCAIGGARRRQRLKNVTSQAVQAEST
jgi:hypothetical protein